MTIATDKKDFIANWEDFATQFTSRLGQSANKPATWKEIKLLQEEMKQLIAKVADECYGEVGDVNKKAISSVCSN